MGGMLVKLMVPEEVIAIIASSAPIQEAGLPQAFLEMAHSVGNYAVLELDNELVWREESLWPVAYSRLFEQLVGILEVPEPEFESIIVTATGLNRTSAEVKHTTSLKRACEQDFCWFRRDRRVCLRAGLLAGGGEVVEPGWFG
jgi:hypothetical protein